MFEYIEYILNDKTVDNIDDILIDGEYYRVIVFEDNTVLRIKIKEN